MATEAADGSAEGDGPHPKGLPEAFGRFTSSARGQLRLELETPTLTLAESQYALGALALLGEGRSEMVDVLKALLRKVQPTLVPRVG